MEEKVNYEYKLEVKNIKQYCYGYDCDTDNCRCAFEQ